jgi:hypothetical protein
MDVYTNKLLNSRIDTLLFNHKLNIKFRYHILYIVYHIRTYPFKNKSFKDGDYVPIKLEYLRKLISFDYTKILLQAMIESKILKSDNRYVIGGKSKGYSILEDIIKTKFYLEPMEDKKLAFKIKNKLKESTDLILKREDGYSYVTKCMNNLEMDYIEANKYLNSKNISLNIKSKLKMMVDIFHDKFATIDDKGHRLHNNLTNIASPLRRTLRYNGNSLVQCDLKNSQPLLLIAMFNRCFLPKEETDKYLNVVCNIGFYEFFAEKLEVTLTDNNRSDFKKKIFGGVLFDKNRKVLSKYEEVFKQEFPLMFYCLRDMKKEDYKSISIELQKLESNFIFICIDKIRKENKDIELLTIHDSICCIDGKEQIIYKVMIEEFFRIFGIVPKIKIEKFI